MRSSLLVPAPRVLRPLEAKPRLRASLLRRGVPRPGAGIEKGAKVRVLEGPFAGKEGLVQELDGNGGARVMLGLLAVRIDERQGGQVDQYRPRHCQHRCGGTGDERVGRRRHVEFASHPQHARAVSGRGPDLHSISRHFASPPFCRQ